MKYFEKKECDCPCIFCREEKNHSKCRTMNECGGKQLKGADITSTIKPMLDEIDRFQREDDTTKVAMAILELARRIILKNVISAEQSSAISPRILGEEEK